MTYMPVAVMAKCTVDGPSVIVTDGGKPQSFSPESSMSVMSVAVAAALPAAVVAAAEEAQLITYVVAVAS